MDSSSASNPLNSNSSNAPTSAEINNAVKTNTGILNKSNSIDPSIKPTETNIDSQAKQKEFPQNHSTNDLINPIEHNSNESGNLNSINSVETSQIQTVNAVNGINNTLLTVEELISKISANKSPRIVSLLKSVKCDINSNSFKITASSQLHMVAFEELRISLTQDLILHSNGQITEFVLEMGEVEYSARRPYTDKEKLDYLIEKHPKLLDAMEKLQLRLP